MLERFHFVAAAGRDREREVGEDRSHSPENLAYIFHATRKTSELHVADARVYITHIWHTDACRNHGHVNNAETNFGKPPMETRRNAICGSAYAV